MSKMTQLADAIVNSGIRVPDENLPYPNIYMSSVYGMNRPAVHTYIAADFTEACVKKTANWCAEIHKFRPTRSTAVVKVRRMRLTDIIENPAAYETALQRAKANGESDIVARLQKLPEWISRRLGAPIPSDADGLWDKLGESIARLEERKLRPAAS